MIPLSEFVPAPGTSYTLEGGRLLLQAPPRSDFVVDAFSGAIHGNAAFLYREVEGDFVFHAKVSQCFRSTYDAPALMAFESETRWAKACFEYTDLGSRAVVSVFTDGRSDDCNGVETERDAIWLQLCRRGGVFAVHYSFGGAVYRMQRIAHLPLTARLKVGLVAQSPLGEGGTFSFEEVYLAQETKQDLRGGN